MCALRAHNAVKEILVPAKTGFTVLSENTALHSRYDPAQEAEKYISSLSLKAHKYFILIEPGLDYLAAALKKKFPLSSVISLHCSSFFPCGGTNKNIPAESEFNWNPSLPQSLEDFLESHLADAGAENIKLIDWKPSVNIYGNACLELVSRTVECIRIISAGRKTVRNFGKRWFKNALHNLALLQNPVFAIPGTAPVLVCASGPGLEGSLQEIAEWEKKPFRPFIIAVSSAAPALLCRGIKPDLIITTDGGSWAYFHITESIRECEKISAEKPVIASSLTAELPSQTKNYRNLVLRDGSLWQDILLKSAGILTASLAFPQRGTVSISALDLAFYLTKGNVYICGMDFAHSDLLTHARPYAFDKLAEQRQNREEPYYSLLFERENMIQNSGSLSVYSSWFLSNLSLFSDRLFSYGKSIQGIKPGNPMPDEREEFPPFTKIYANPKTSVKSSIAVLQNALNNPLFAKQLCTELGELLLPDIRAESAVLADEIKKTLPEFSRG